MSVEFKYSNGHVGDGSQAVSGIMVEGIDNDESIVLTKRNVCVNKHDGPDSCEECKGSFSDETQDFRDAEMIVIEALPVSTSFQDGKAEEGEYAILSENSFRAHGVYGNKVVSTIISGSKVRALKQLTKITWATKKPYILNGVLRTIAFSGER